MPDLERELAATIVERVDAAHAPIDLAARARAAGAARQRRRRLALASWTLGCAAAAVIAAVVLVAGWPGQSDSLRPAGPGPTGNAQQKAALSKAAAREAQARRMVERAARLAEAKRFVAEAGALLGPSFTPPTGDDAGLSSRINRAPFTSPAGVVTVTEQDAAPPLTASDIGPGTETGIGPDGSTVLTRTTSAGIVQVVVLTPDHRMVSIVAQPASLPGQAPLGATRLTQIAEQLLASG